MKKFLSVLTALLLILSLCGVYSFAADYFYNENEIPQGVKTVAENSVSMLRNHYASNPEMYSFSNADEAMSLELGTGYKIDYVSNKNLFEEDIKISDLLSSEISDSWLYTLDLNGVPRIYLTICEENEEFVISSYGGNANKFAVAREKMNDLIDELQVVTNAQIISSGGLYAFYVEADGEEYLVFEETSSGSTSTYSINKTYITGDEYVEQLKDINTETNNDVNMYGNTGTIVTSTKNLSQITIWIYLFCSFAAVTLTLLVVFFIKKKYFNS